MVPLPQLTQYDVSRWIGERSFERGQTYFHQGAIYHALRQGSTLKAECLGSQPKPYHVEIELGSQGIVAGRCSCPVGENGRCKHAAALLLTWLNTPQDFLEMEDLQTFLGNRSKEDLIRLICKMIATHPDLEYQLKLPSPVAGEAAKPIDPKLIRRQVVEAFRSAGDEWGAAWDVARSLEEVVKTGEDYAQSGNWLNAQIIYRTVAWEVLQEYETVQEEEGELIEIVNRCVGGLKECLAATTDPIERGGILRTLFDIYRWDVDYGGIDAGEEAPGIILELATHGEKQRIAQWVQEAVDAGGSESRDYQRQTHGGFLLDLKGEDLDDESFLAICRNTGRLQDLVARLLRLDRVEEAMTEAHAASDYDLLRMAELFEAQRQGNLVEKLIRERSETSNDRRLIEWLKKWAIKRGDIPEALKHAEQLFRAYPSLQDYREVRTLAQELGRWEKLRFQLMDRLLESKQYALLTEIHLLEGEIDAALEIVNRSSDGSRAWEGSKIRVAEAAAKSRPREAIPLYVEAAARLIEARDRKNYALAVEYLGRVRELYRRLDDETTWQSFITNLREKNRRLSALKEELNKAGL